MNDTSSASLYGPVCSSDNLFTRKARFAQSWYRVHKLNNQVFGIGPHKNSPNKWGNMLVDGHLSGANFILPATFIYAKQRVADKQSQETIDAFRLFNNMLSSMPLCFNFFHPLMLMMEQDRLTVSSVFKLAFPEFNIETVDEIKIEFVPTQQSLGDKSGIDAAILYTNTSGEKGLIAIEVKYTDKLGTNNASNSSKHIDFAIEREFFTEAGLSELKKNSSQIFRNFLMAEYYGQNNKLAEVYSVILSPQNNPYTEKEVTSFVNLLDSSFQHKMIKEDLESLVNAIKPILPPEYIDWINKFEDRYLTERKVS